MLEKKLQIYNWVAQFIKSCSSIELILCRNVMHVLPESNTVNMTLLERVAPFQKLKAFQSLLHKSQSAEHNYSIYQLIHLHDAASYFPFHV